MQTFRPSVEEWQSCVDTARLIVRDCLLQRGHLKLKLHVFEIMWLTTDPELQLMLANAADQPGSSIKLILDFEAFDETMDDLIEDGVGIPARADIDAGLATVGNIVGRFQTITKLSFQYYSVSLPVALAILVPCRHVKKLDLQQLWDPAHDLVATLQTYLQQLQSLEGIQFYEEDHVLLPAIEMFSTTLPQCCPQLMLCSIDTGEMDDHWTASWQGAAALRNIMSMPSLTSLSLHDFRLETREAVREFCVGLRSSNHLGLEITTLFGFPSATEELMAESLTYVDELRLKDVDFERPKFFESLGRNMGRWDCKLQAIAVIGSYEPAQSFNLAICSLLRHAHDWKLQKLCLHNLEWTTDFDEAISAYLRTNNDLRTLSWSLPEYRRGGAIASDAILGALDRPGLLLEELTLLGRFDEEWLAKVNFIIKLNSQRRRHGLRLSRTTTAGQLAMELQEVDGDCLFEFLRRNEFNLQVVLRKFGGRATVAAPAAVVTTDATEN